MVRGASDERVRGVGGRSRVTATCERCLVLVDAGENADVDVHAASCVAEIIANDTYSLLAPGRGTGPRM